MPQQKLTRGHKAILLGAIPAGGGLALTFPKTVGYIKENSASAKQEKLAVEKYRAEGISAPIDISYEDGDMMLMYTLMNPDVEALQYYFGGTLTGTAPNQSWNAPSDRVILEAAVKSVPKQGFTVTYPRVALAAYIEQEMSKTGLFTVVVEGYVLKPEDTTVSHMIVSNPPVV